MAVPLGLTEIFIGIYYRADTVLLSLFDTDAVVGWYDAAYTFVYVLRLLPVTAALVLLPALTNLYSKSKQKGIEVYQTILYYSVAFGFLITFLITVNSHILVPLVYGSEYLRSAGVLRLLIWTCVIMFANAFQGIFLVITHQRVAFFRATALGAISNVLLNLFLIPKWSMYGAAAATVLSEFLVFVSCAASLRKFVNLTHYARMLLLPIAGTILMFLAWLLFGSTQFFLGNLICAVLYVGVFAIRRFRFSATGTR